MVAQTYQQQIGSWGDPHDSAGLKAKIRARELYLLQYVQQQVASLPTYYFSNSSGSDSNPGTIGQPMKTMAKANSMPGIQALFKAGDEWNELTGITLSQAGKLGVYGAGPKPFFNLFSVKIPAASFSNVSGTTWATTVSDQIGMIRIQGRQGNVSPFIRIQGRQGNAFPQLAVIPGTTLGNNWFAFAWTTSLANCEAADFPAWFQSGTTVYVNIAGTGLSAAPAMEAQIGQTSGGASGVVLAADGTWCDGIRADGWGIGAATSGWSSNENGGLLASVTGTQVALFTRADAFFSSAHNVYHYSSGGGIVVAKNVRAGWCCAAGNTTNFINFSTNGGHEAYHFENQVIGGYVPFGTGGFWQQNGANNAGKAFYGHAGASGTYVATYISRNCRVSTDTQAWPGDVAVSASVAPVTDWANVTGICVGLKTGKIPSGYQAPVTGATTTALLPQIFNDNFVSVDCEQDDVVNARSGNTWGYDNSFNSLSINCRYRIRSEGAAISSASYNSSASDALLLHNSEVLVSGAVAPSFSLVGNGNAATVFDIQNSVVGAENATTLTLAGGGGGTFTTQKNAYFPSVPSQDSTGTLLSTFPTGEEEPAPGDPTYQAGLPTIGYAAVTQDAHNQYRSPTTPSIGALEYNEMTQPTENNVVLGVQYGVDGNSLTGTRPAANPCVV